MYLNNGLKGLVTVALITTLAGCEKADNVPAADAEDYALDTQQKKVSYLVGLDTANEWSSRGVPLDSEALALAVRDVLAGNQERLSKEEIEAALASFQQDQLLKQQELAKQQEQAQAVLEAEFDKLAAENLKAGQEFLANNSNQKDVVTLPSGLQYKVLTTGEGSTPAATDTVEVHYRGTLLDGTEFDSSHKRGEPVSFPVNAVIAGWTEALQLMKEGDKWQLFIPGGLAYGPGGSGPAIGPNATLMFDVELLQVTPAP